MNKFAYDDPKRPKILAIDVDGTILEYDSYMGRDVFGEPIRGMREELQEFRDAEVLIVLWTCRPDTPALRAHFKKHDLPFDHVNDHPWNGPDDPRKIHADWYVDDKGELFNGVATGLAKRVMSRRPWWQQADWL
jgi:hypothetical protein